MISLQVETQAFQIAPSLQSANPTEVQQVT